MRRKKWSLSDGRVLDVVPWTEEPMHHCLHKADWCVVYEARLPPGTTTMWHVHDKNTVYVCIEDGSKRGKPVISTAVNDAEDVLHDPVEFEVGCGDTFCMWHADKTFTHQVSAHESNVGETRFLGIEILRTPAISGRNDELQNFQYTLMEDREIVKIWKLYLLPNSTTGKHSIAVPSVFVALSEGNLESNGSVRNEGVNQSDEAFPFRALYYPGQFHVLKDPMELCIVNRGPGGFEAMLVQWSRPDSLPD